MKIIINYGDGEDAVIGVSEMLKNVINRRKFEKEITELLASYATNGIDRKIINSKNIKDLFNLE